MKWEIAPLTKTERVLLILSVIFCFLAVLLTSTGCSGLMYTEGLELPPDCECSCRCSCPGDLLVDGEVVEPVEDGDGGGDS